MWVGWLGWTAARFLSLRKAGISWGGVRGGGGRRTLRECVGEVRRRGWKGRGLVCWAWQDRSRAERLGAVEELRRRSWGDCYAADSLPRVVRRMRRAPC